MKISHIALFVQDLDGGRDFFIKYFGAKANELYHNPVTGFSSYFLSFNGGAQIELCHKPDMTPARENMTGYAHIAFSMGSREAVNELTALLNSSGYQTISGPRVTGDGYYESCIRGFEDNLIEIME